MTSSGKYIYGFIHSSTEERFEFGEQVAPEDIYPLGNAADAVGRHESSNGAYAVVFRDIAAVVSDSDPIDTTHMSKESLARLLIGHQRLLENVMTRYSTIPMRLGTVARNLQDVETILSHGYNTIKDILINAQGTVEIDVAVTLSDFPGFLQGVSQTPEILRFKQTLLDKPNGVTPEDQVKAGLLMKKHVDRKKEMLALQVQAELAPDEQGIKVHALMDDTMVFNGAFLVLRTQQTEFDEIVEQLDKTFKNTLNFRCVGPLPPYSFYTLEVKRMNFTDILWAKDQLGLTSDCVTAKEIQKAHHKTALTCHPDKHPGKSGIEKKFDEMNKAYRILLDYYRASRNKAEPDQTCYLNEEALEETSVLVTIMG